MKRVALALLLLLTHNAAAQPAARAADTDGLGLIDRTEPAQEQARLDKGSYDARSRVLARAVAAAPHSDEALAVLIYAAERARALELREPELCTLARGLARRAPTKAARDGLFALLTTAPREGVDGRALHQRIAAMALASVADLADPLPFVALPSEGAAPAAPPPLGTLDKLLELADESRFEEPITNALLRHPPRTPPRGGATAASLRIGATLGDLRWARVLELALRDARNEALRIAALDAARALGDARTLRLVLARLNDPSPTVAAAAWHTWLSLAPARALPELERRLARADAPLPMLALARYIVQPALLDSVAARLAAQDTPRLAEAARILATLPNGAGVTGLAKLTRHADTLQLGVDSLEKTPGAGATRALTALLADARTSARHEAAFALFARALAAGPDALPARRALESSARDARGLSAVIRHWLAGAATPRARAAAALDAHAQSAAWPLATLAECARALRTDAPGCAYGFGAALPRSPDETQRADLHVLLESPDEAIVARLHDGLMQSTWPGRHAALARALERADVLPLRRHLARLARAHVHAASNALTRSVELVASAEPDLVVAHVLAGRSAGMLPHPRLIRAAADGHVRCGYATDEMGVVTPLVIEEGGALLPAAHGSTLSLTFTRCEDAILSATALR